MRFAGVKTGHKARSFMFIRSLYEGLLQLVYPLLCEACQRPLLGQEKVLCLECNLLLPQTHYHHIAENATAQKLAGRIHFDHATSFAYFTKDGLLQHLLHRMKYDFRKEIGNYLGTQFAVALKQTAWIGDITALVPVPLHQRKQRLRGGNQSLWIAEGMSSVLQLPVLPHTLRRIKHTKSQTKMLSREQRLENIKDAFAVPEPAMLEGQHILLVDDVLTTGATLEACALTLEKAGGIRISIATIGLAGS